MSSQKSASSSSSKPPSDTMRCASILITASGHNSESLPSNLCQLQVTKSGGISAGHKWTIGHDDWDYAKFLEMHAVYLGGSDNNRSDGYDNGSNRNGSDNGNRNDGQPLIFQTRTDSSCNGGGDGTHKLFECIPHPSLTTAQVRAFVATVVKYHEKWRAKHPGRGQVVNGNVSGAVAARGAAVGAGAAQSSKRQVGRTVSGRSSGMTSKKKKNKSQPPSRNDDACTTTTTAGLHHDRRTQLRSLQQLSSAKKRMEDGGDGEKKGQTRTVQLIPAGGRKRKMTVEEDAGGDDIDDREPDAERRGMAMDRLVDTDDEEEEEEVVEEGKVNDEKDNDDDDDVEQVAKSEKIVSKQSKTVKPNLRVDTGAGTDASEGAGTTNTEATTTTAGDDSKSSVSTNDKSHGNKSKKAKTVTPTPTGSTASRKEQQGKLTEHMADQSQRQQPDILHFFGGGDGGSGGKKSSAAAEATTSAAETKTDDGTDGDEDGGNAEEEQSQMDTNTGGRGDSDDDNDDIIDMTDRQPKSKFDFSGSPSSTNAGPPSTARKNRRRNTAYGRNRPSASSQARGGIDHGLVRSSPGGGFGPPSKKTKTTMLTRQPEQSITTSSSSVNEDPFIFDDGKATPTSYLPTMDLTSVLMVGGGNSRSTTPNRTYGRNRSSSSSASPNKSRSPGTTSSQQRLFTSKRPRNATPLSRMAGPTSSASFDRPVGGRRLGGKELLAQQKRAAEEDEPISDEDEYQRAGDLSDDDATVTVENDYDDGSWDASNGSSLSIPSTPPTVRRSGYNSESIMPGRIPRSRREWERSRDDHGSPVHRRDTSIAHSNSHRSPQTWGSALRTNAKKSTGIVREGPFDNFGSSPDTMGAVSKLDDRFGRCASPMMEEEDDGLYDTDDEKSRKREERLANNPYRSPGWSRIHNRNRLKSEEQSRYFSDHQMSTADSALLPRGPMRGGLGRGRHHRGLSMGARSSGRHGGHTPYQRPRRGRDDYYSDQNSWDRIESDRKRSTGDFFSKRGRNGFDRAAERAKNNVCTGLRNLGNTCYLNSSLQTLFSVPGFAADLRSTRDLIIAKYGSRHGDKSKAKLPLTNALIDTAVDLGVLSSEEPLGQQAGEGAAEGESRPSSHNRNMFADPKDLKKAIDALTDLFHGYQQQDAHEAIGFIIDALHDELAAAAKKVKGDTISADEASGAKDVDIVLPTDKYFRVEFREQNICIDCGFTSGDITSVLRNLPIAISKDENKPWTVQESLHAHFAPETRDLKCEKCPCKKARHTTRVTKKPGALLLSFKRFVQEMPKPAVDHQDKPVDKENANANGGSTNDLPPLEASAAASSAPPAAPAFVMPTIIRSKVRVCLQEKVSLEPFMLKDDESGDSTSKSNSFDAVGVVHHIGSTPHSGHYTADAVRNRDLGLFDDSRLGEGEKKWVTFDDTATTFTDKTTVLEGETSQRNTYMAMFVAE